MTSQQGPLRARETEAAVTSGKVIRIRLLGARCAQCEMLYQSVAQLARELDLKIDIKRISEIRAVVGYDILARPALVIDGVLEAAGYLPSPEQLRAMLARHTHFEGVKGTNP